MSPERTILLTASVTVLDVLFLFFATFRTAIMRGRHAILAPATVGHPEFDRAYRVQMNTLEQLVMFLPLMWIAALYPIGWPWLAPAFGVLFVIGRALYMQLYMADPAKRGPGAGLTGLTIAAVLLLAIAGLIKAWLRPGT
jgi:uncharacterized membrane protein YecN with MAPEG domain